MSSHKYINKFYNSLFSACVASTLTNPLWVMKVRMQTANLKSFENPNNPKPSYYHICSQIHKNEGMIGYTKGLRATLFNNMKLGIQFPLYDYLNEKTNSVLVSSILAKTTSSIIFFPLDVVRINQRNSTENLSIGRVLTMTYQKNGFKGFYRGITLSLAGTMPNFVLMMIIRDKIFKL